MGIKGACLNLESQKSVESRIPCCRHGITIFITILHHWDGVEELGLLCINI